jgi:glycosyltransferase involved in cell wall biosynthesis
MPSLHYFYRHTNPIFFSIERVFGNIAAEVRREHGTEFTVEEIKMPLVTSIGSLRRNTVFTHRRQADINHITGDVHYVILGCSRRKVNVLTVHDCVALQKYPKTDPRYWALKWIWFSWPVRRADHITVISESTKEELMRLVRIRPDRISVIPNYIDPCFQPSPAVFDEHCPRILFIGSTPNKNLYRLIAALKDIPVILDIVGEPDQQQREALEKAGIRYEQSSRLSQDELVAKYRDCDLLCFPSTYEGFGLPIVEAQAVGRPVLTSDLSPMREVAGAGACLVDPYDSASIRRGLLRIIGEPHYRDDLVRKGLANVSRFSLGKVTEEYLLLYRRLLGRKTGQAK